MSVIVARHLMGFDDPRCGPDCWDRLLARSDTRVVFLTRQWLQAWWETVAQGDLLLIAAERAGEVVALAPLFAMEGMVFFLGAGESDYLDFLGEAGDSEVMAALLTAARDGTPGFVGFKFHLLPESSANVHALRGAADRLGMEFHEEAELPAVNVDLAGRTSEATAAVNRSMRDRESYCRRHGTLGVRSYDNLTEIRPHLEEFYAQHTARWQAKGLPGQFSDPAQRAFLERFLELAADTGWIRFLRIDWKDRPLAFEFAWYFGGTHYSGPWCFDVKCANQSPGQILLRQSMLAALAEGLDTYDLGTGDQEYKLRLPVRTRNCRTWGLYPA